MPRLEISRGGTIYLSQLDIKQDCAGPGCEFHPNNPGSDYRCTLTNGISLITLQDKGAFQNSFKRLQTPAPLTKGAVARKALCIPQEDQDQYGGNFW